MKASADNPSVECEFCNREWEDLQYYDSKNWRVQLHTDQYYLGRSLVVLKRHIVDINEMGDAERDELFNSVLPELKETIDTMFGPDLYNYASLGNSERHLHFHVIPRYSDTRSFAGQVFNDEAWNSHYKNGEGRYVSREVLDEVMESLVEELN